MKTSLYILYIYTVLAFLCGFPRIAKGQTVLERSEALRPDWLAHKMPMPSNPTFTYRIAEASDPSLTKAKYDCVIELAEQVKQNKRIEGKIRTGGSLEQVQGNKSSYIEFEYTNKGEALQIIYRKIDEYWEYVSYGDSRIYHCYALYAIANDPNREALFDEISFSKKYGASGMLRSFIPGYGQLYKGSKVKGLCIMGGEAALIGGVIAFENMRSNYYKKARQTQDAGHIKSYTSKANDYRTFRDVCIGGAVALYIYNLIDALVANGSKRTIVKKSGLALYPMASPEGNGLSLSYRF